jgi:hypothetical protein
VLAVERANAVDLALLVHILGAMVLVGGLLTAATAGLAGWNDESARLRRFSYMTLLCIALPGWIVMRVGAEWIYNKESYDKLPDSSIPTWLDIGGITADVGGALLLIALIVGAIGYKRRTDGLLKIGTAISLVLVAVYVVAVWAMGGKPS